MDSIEKKFLHLSNNPSDINEHLCTLSKYSSDCESVLETGVATCVSSWAFVHGLLNNKSLNKKLFMNDINVCNISELLFLTHSLPIKIEYEWKNNLDLELKERYDLTFIDTWHVYGQLKRELIKFAPITNKYIIMHDTTIDEWKSEIFRVNSNAEELSKTSGFSIEEIEKGLWPAVQEFLDANKDWVLHERYTNNNGLTILRRV